MILDTTYFGYGMGLVIVGWVCGMIFSVVIKVISSGSKYF